MNAKPKEVPRRVVDEMTKRIVDQTTRNGRPMPVDQAKKIATDSAERHNRELQK